MTEQSERSLPGSIERIGVQFVVQYLFSVHLSSKRKRFIRAYRYC
jgi:hypothetical protein